MNTQRIMLPLAVSLFLLGCEASRYPAGAPGEMQVDEGLLGVWRAMDHTDPGEHWLLAMSIDSTRYYLEFFASSPQTPFLPIHQQRMRLLAHSNRIGGATFASISCLGGQDDCFSGYLIAQYLLLEDGRLKVQVVDPEAIDSAIASTGELSGFLKVRLADESLYRAMVHFERIATAPEH